MPPIRSLLLALAAAIAVPQPANAVIWTVNNHEYQLVGSSGAPSWTAARNAAQALGPGWDLVTITSAAEQAFLVANLLPAAPADRVHYWIGANDATTEGTFNWVTGEAFGYTNWHASEPNNQGNEDYVALDFRSGIGWAWNDAPDNLGAPFVRGYIVERGATAVPEPATLALLGLGLLGFAFSRRSRRD